MPFLLLVGALLVGAVALVTYSRRAESSPAEPSAPRAPTLRELYAKHGAAYGVDPLLIEAIAMVESSQRADAVRWNPPHDVSVGVMQVLCAPPADALPGSDFVCQNRFNISPWPVRFSELKNPDLNIALGVQILAWNLRTFGFPRGVAVFNMYSMRHAGIDGPFENRQYVDRVLSIYQGLKGAL